MKLNKLFSGCYFKKIFTFLLRSLLLASHLFSAKLVLLSVHLCACVCTLLLMLCTHVHIHTLTLSLSHLRTLTHCISYNWFNFTFLVKCLCHLDLKNDKFYFLPFENKVSSVLLFHLFSTRFGLRWGPLFKPVER